MTRSPSGPSLQKRPSVPHISSDDPLLRPPSPPQETTSFKRRSNHGNDATLPRFLTGLLSRTSFRSPSSSRTVLPDPHAPPSPHRFRHDQTFEMDEEEVDGGVRTPTASTFSLLAPGSREPQQQRRSTITSQMHRNPPLLYGERDGAPSTPGGGGPPKIPHVIPSLPQYATPLPKLPLLVLCFAMLSEFLSASVAGPFTFFFLEDVGVGKGENGGGEAAVGFWAGVVSSSFFLTQFLTSLLWANLSLKYGRRAILFTSLMGNCMSLALFGMSKNLGHMICLRLAQGIFNGAIGVARGAVRDITDPTNENMAMSWMGVCWGMGGIVGPILGGLLEHPAENYPSVFGGLELLRQYPYVLPCWIASSVTFTGALLSLFLGYDGGLREGAIQLPEEKVPKSSATGVSHGTDVNSSGFSGLQPKVTGYFDRTSSPLRPGQSPITPPPLGASSRRPSGPAAGGTVHLPLSGTCRRQSSALGQGNAYGYNRRFSVKSAQRRFSLARSAARSGEDQGEPEREEPVVEPQSLNFAQRLLLSNEDAVFGIHDVWFAAATAQEAEDEYSQMDPQDEWMGSVFDDDDNESQLGRRGSGEEDDQFGFEGSEPQSMEDLRGKALAQTPGQTSMRGRLRREDARSQQQSMSSQARLEPPNSYLPSSYASGVRLPRPSMSSQRPAIFNNTGLATPPMVSPLILSTGEEVVPFFEQGAGQTMAGTGQVPTLAAIPETRPVSYVDPTMSTNHAANGLADAESQNASKAVPSAFSMLPLAIIAQYAVLALHGTMCDQVFMSLLVTPVGSGGLGLSASHYAELIAAMCVVQVVAQFRFYPNFGPPRGSWSHISMFRLGMALYIPVYLLFPELRGLSREDHNWLVMFGMILLSTFRWVANVCAYTAVMILVNAQTPPHLVPLANGLAQSAVSMARFLGPVTGGIIWSFSITPSPDARPYPFNNALGFVIIAGISFLGLLTSFRLK